MRVISFGPSSGNSSAQTTVTATSGIRSQTPNEIVVNEPTVETGNALSVQLTSTQRMQYETGLGETANNGDTFRSRPRLHERQNSVMIQQWKQKKSSHSREYAKMVAFIYAILLVVIGLLLSLSEALSHVWLGTSTNAAFVTYLLVTSTVFLIFLQFYLLRSPTTSSEDHSNDRSLRSLLIRVIRRLQSCVTSRQQTEQTAATAVVRSHTTTPSSFESPPSLTSLAYDNDVQLTVASSLGRLSPTYDLNNNSNNGNALVSRNVTFGTAESHGYPRQDSRGILGFVPSHVTGEAGRHRHSSEISSLSLDGRLPRDSVSIDEDEMTLWLDLDQLGDIFSHHGSSLYLRLGALIFGLGNVIECGVEIQNWLSPDPHCSLLHYNYGWTFILRLIFIVFQTFVLFKGTHVRIVRFHSVAELGFLHLIATNLCLWLQTLIREITLMFETSLVISAQSHDSSHETSANNTANTTTSNDSCSEALLLTITVYLYPFVLEYSLIAIGAIGSILFTGIGTEDKDDNKHNMAMGFRNLIRVFRYGIKIDQPDDDRHKNADNTEHNADDKEHHRHGDTFAKSHSGLFIGVLLLAGVITSVVLSYFNMSSSHEDTAMFIYHVTDIVLNALLLVACCLALYLTNQLSYVDRPVSTDDFLLFLSMAGCLMFELSVTTAGVAAISANDPHKSTLQLVGSILATVQTILQTILILFAMRRHPSTSSDVINMPGRGTFAFLVVANIAAWIERTLQVRHSQSLEGHFYGSVAWILLNDINRPLLLFYRFHSSLCFADIWNVAYTPLRRDAIKRSTKRMPRLPPSPVARSTTMAPSQQIMVAVPSSTTEAEHATGNQSAAPASSASDRRVVYLTANSAPGVQSNAGRTQAERLPEIDSTA